MHVLYFILLSLNISAETQKVIKVLPNPEINGEFAHEFKGCPENSDCDQAMGLMLQKWKDEITKITNSSLNDAQKARLLESFRSKYGIPTEFYTNDKSKQAFRPILYNSSCRQHNPKTPSAKTLRGISFIKSIDEKKAIIWKDQNQLEVPNGDLFNPQKVTVYFESPAHYFLGLGDQPLFIKNKNLYILKEEDSFYFMLEISATGDWKIVDLDFSTLSTWENRREPAPCPEDKSKPSEVFNHEFCKSVWDVDLKKTVVVKMQDGCSI